MCQIPPILNIVSGTSRRIKSSLSVSADHAEVTRGQDISVSSELGVGDTRLPSTHDEHVATSRRVSTTSSM
jgi:hypothetical protein